MKNSLIVLALLLLVGCNQQRSVVGLPRHKAVERIKIGMPLQKAVEKASGKGIVVEKAIIPAYEGEPAQVEYRAFEGKKLLYTFNAGPNGASLNTVFRIVIYDPKYTTPEGISVGSTVKDLRKSSKLKAADFNQDDGLYITASSFDGGFLLNLDTSKDYSGFDYVKPTVASLPNELTVKAIVLF